MHHVNVSCRLLRAGKYWNHSFLIFLQTGKQQHYELGQWLRKRYNSLVSEKYNSSEMYVRSTDVDRTLMSAESNLAGFYPPKSKDLWNDEVQWQPIPVHTVPEKQDSILAAKKNCPVYDYELKKLYKSSTFKNYDTEFKPIYDYLTTNSGKKVHSLQSVQNIYSCLHIEELNNLALPEWTRRVYPDKLFPISGLSFAVKAYTPLLARLKSGPLLKHILKLFKEKSLKQLTPDRSYWVYSAHDTTVANMLNTLGVFKVMGYHNPPFAATIMFELRKLDKEYRVQVFYKNSTGEPQPLDLPGCGTSCALDKMFEVYKPVLPVDWEKECSLSLLQMPLMVDVDDSMSLTAIFAFICLMMITGFIVLFFATVYKRRDYLSEREWDRLEAYNWSFWFCCATKWFWFFFLLQNFSSNQDFRTSEDRIAGDIMWLNLMTIERYFSFEAVKEVVSDSIEENSFFHFLFLWFLLIRFYFFFYCVNASTCLSEFLKPLLTF